MNHSNSTFASGDCATGHQASTRELYDLAIIGGGVNGCGIARDAAGRGASTILFEQGDLAAGTSSASTKLIHGGLRYLEQYELRLVREALRERAVLWRLAPHIVRPLRFILPHHAGLRPQWMLRLGLFLYDHLGSRGGLPGARRLDLLNDPAGEPLKDQYRVGFEYSDCWVDDARLVVLTALDAAERGAVIRTHSRVESARVEDGVWRILVSDPRGESYEVRARALVNAAGPWVADAARRVGASSIQTVRLVKGSHIVVPRVFDGEQAYIFQNGDGRVVFAIPYERDFTLIGTTDQDWHGTPETVQIDDEEAEYLCAATRDYFRQPVLLNQVIWSYSGVRPLVDDGSARPQEATRDYLLELHAEPGRPPLLCVYGGKITTHRRLAEAALRKLAPLVPSLAGRSWTGSKPLPGGDVGGGGLPAIREALAKRHPYLAARHADRLISSYGSRAFDVLAEVQTPKDLGQTFVTDLTAVEVDYLMRVEWASAAEDVLWRRSKLGLRASAHQACDLETYMAAAHARSPGANRN